MARALLIGCGCSGRAAGSILRSRGWAVRGTSRSAAGRDAIEAAGLEAAPGDPDRVGTVVSELGDVTVLGWLLGSARGDVAAVHGPRLERTLEKLVDTPVRGFVYEASGTVAPELLAGGRQLVEEASQRWRIPIRVFSGNRGEPEAWASGVADAVEGVLGL